MHLYMHICQSGEITLRHLSGAPCMPINPTSRNIRINDQTNYLNLTYTPAGRHVHDIIYTYILHYAVPSHTNDVFN